MPNSAALQLFIATKNKKYANIFTNAIWQGLERSLDRNIEDALIAIPYFDKEYKAKLDPYIKKLKKENDSLLLKNPYGVPVGIRHWGGNSEVVRWATMNYLCTQSISRNHRTRIHTSWYQLSFWVSSIFQCFVCCRCGYTL